MGDEMRLLLGATTSHGNIDDQIELVLCEVVLDALFLTLSAVLFERPINDLDLKDKKRLYPVGRVL